MIEPTNAIPKGGDDLTNLEQVPGADTLPNVDPDSSAALDKLMAEVVEQTDPPVDEAAEAKAKAKADADAKAKADADAKAKADADAKAKADAGNPDAEAKAKADADAKAKADADAKAKEPPKSKLDEVTLPPHASPKSSEAFAKVKLLAKQEIEETAKRADEALAKTKELEEKVKAAEAKAGEALTPELKKELEELREFRLKLDVEADPSFKDYEKKISENHEAIYAKLKSAGSLTDEHIKKIKELGGPDQVDWDSPKMQQLPKAVLNYVQHKLTQNEELVDQKKTAIEKAKANATEFLKNREQQTAATSEARTKATEAKFNEYLPKMGWLKKVESKADATPEQKKADAAHNAFLDEIHKDMQDTLKDDSAETRAVLVLGYAQLKRARADMANMEAAHKAALEAKQAEVAKIEKERDEAKEMVERIKKSSVGRLRDSNAPDNTTVKGKVDITVDGGANLDRLFAEAQAAQG